MCSISGAHNSWIFSWPTLTIAVHYSRGITFISRPTQKRFIEASGLFCKFLSKHSYHQDRWRIFFSTGLNSSSTNLRNVDAAFVRTISMTWNWYRVLPTVKADFFPSHMTPIQLGKWVTGHNKCEPNFPIKTYYTHNNDLTLQCKTRLKHWSAHSFKPGLYSPCPWVCLVDYDQMTTCPCDKFAGVCIDFAMFSFVNWVKLF